MYAGDVGPDDCRYLSLGLTELISAHFFVFFTAAQVQTSVDTAVMSRATNTHGVVHVAFHRTHAHARNPPLAHAQALRDQLPSAFLLNTVVCAHSSGEVILQNYNTLFTLSKLAKCSDGILVRFCDLCVPVPKRVAGNAELRGHAPRLGRVTDI